MSTVKISDLPSITLNANTSNTYFVVVDRTLGITAKVTETQIASGLYTNNNLNVGINPITFPSTIAQFSGTSGTYLQVNLQNKNGNGSSDLIATADIGTDANNYIDFGINGSSFSDPVYSSMKPLDGYIYVHGSNDQSTTGNLVVGTASLNSNIVFIAGGTTSANVVGRINKNKFELLNNVYVTGNVYVTSAYKFADGTTQTTAGSSLAYTQAAYDAANTANTFLQSNDSITLTTAKTYTDTANTYIRSRYLANTSGVMTVGDFGISGNLTTLGVATTGLFTVNATSYIANTPAFRITGSANSTVQAPLNQGYMLQITGFANTSTRMVMDAFGANTYSAFIGRSARGTALNPQATANGDILLRISGNGWGNSFSQFGTGRIDFVAAENYTENTRGSEIQFWNTMVGSNTLNKIATFNANTVIFSGTVSPARGFVYFPKTFPGAQTAITLDFSSDSVVRTNISAPLTVSFTNLLPGKVIELWVTNTQSGGHAITHGCIALNSSVNATTYTIPGTSSILVKYMSFKNDSGNTFCSIIHA
jgi:hypothetical protein